MNQGLNADKLDGYHSGNFFRYEGYWDSTHGSTGVNDQYGMNFVYSGDGAPFSWGVMATFEPTRGSEYRLQIGSNGYSNSGLWYRNKSADRGGWTDWVNVWDVTNYNLWIRDGLVPYSQDRSTSRNTDTTNRENGFYWSNSGTMPRDVGDIDIITVNANTSYGHQLGFKFSGGGTTGSSYDGKDLYTRIFSGGSYLPWYTIYTSGNTGWNYNSYISYEPHTRKFIVNGGSNGWNKHAYSKDGYSTDVEASFKPGQTNIAIMVGLNTDPTTDESYGSIDYCWYTADDGVAYIYESGSYIGSYGGYSTGDEFVVNYSGGFIRYYWNGALKRTVARTISGKFYFDSSFYYTTGNIYDVWFGKKTHAIIGEDNQSINALLHSGYGRSDNAAGSTWLFIDDAGGYSSNWGIKHNQSDNLIEYYGRGTRYAYINLNGGNINSQNNFRLLDYGGNYHSSNTLSGYAGEIWFGGNFHIDSQNGYSIYLNYYSEYGTYINPRGGNVGIGTDSPSDKLHLNNGIFRITNNGVTLRIGPMNSSYSHFESSQSFYFNPSLYLDGTLYWYPNSSYYWNGNAGYSSTYYTNNWFRSYGSTGWYNETYGIGWYGYDSSWIRSYNGAGVVAGGFYHPSYASYDYVLTSNGSARPISSLLGLTETYISTSGAGWYKIAYYNADDARGSVRIALITTGGNWVPYYAELTVKEGWNVIEFNQYGRFGYVSGYRYTRENNQCYIEAYFTTAITLYLRKFSVAAYINDYSSEGWTLYNGTAVAGSGTVIDYWDVDSDGHIITNGRIQARRLLIGPSQHSIRVHSEFNYHPAYEDGAGRPGLSISGYYPYLWLTGGAAGNTSHGATITLAATDSGSSGAFKAWTFGINGQDAQWLDLGYGSHNNPHYHGQAGYTSGWSGRVARFEPYKVTVWGTGYDCDPTLHVISSRNGSWVYGGGFMAPNITGGNNIYIPVGQSMSTRNAIGLTHYHYGSGSTSNYAAMEIWGAGNIQRWYYGDMRTWFAGRVDASGFYHNSYGSSNYLLTSNGGARNESEWQRATYTTLRDFTAGTLIYTDISYPDYGDPFYLEIKGNVYGRGYSCFTQVQGYIYGGTIINYGVTHLGACPITGIICMRINGCLCFWFPRQSYWEGYSITVNSAYDYRVNRVTSVVDSGDPGGDKRIDLSANTIYNINSSNFTGYTDGRYLRYEGWWGDGSGQNVNDSYGMNFTYTSHGAPHHWGTTVTFEYQRGSSYRLQLHGTGDNYLYFRNRSADYGGWHSSGWKQILTNQDTYVASDGTNRGIINGVEVQSARHLLINGVTWNSDWYWSDQGGQPSWLWGSNDGANMYVWNPSNFSVNYAQRAAYLDGHGVNPDNSHPGYGARVFYSWNIGQAGNSSSGYSNGITIGSHPSDTAYGFQIVQNMWDDNTYTRRYNGGWQSWRTLLNDANWTSYVDGRYLRLSGGTMNSGAQILVATTSKGSSDVYNGGIQLREATFSTTSCTDNMYDAPGITFHWGGWWVHKLNMHSNALCWDNSVILTSSNWSSYISVSSGSTTCEYPAGFTSRGSSDWSGVPGTFATDWSVNGADIMFKYNGSNLNVITDGYFYQGIDIYGSSKRVLDTYDSATGTYHNADLWDGYHLVVGTPPSSPDSSTIYIVV